MGTATALAPGLSRKLKKVLETRTDTPDLLASLNTLSTFYADNNAHARRNLRSTIEKRSLSINDEFLLSSDSAQQALDRVEEEVNALAECCDKYGYGNGNSNWNGKGDGKGNPMFGTSRNYKEILPVAAVSALCYAYDRETCSS